MRRTVQRLIASLACGFVLALATPAFGQITKLSTTNLLAAPRHDAAYDTVNDVYLLVHEGPPVRGQFLDRNGNPVGAMFNISLETPIGSNNPYTSWANVAFGGTPQDPTFLVTYLAIEGSAVPKYGRLVRFRPGNTPTVTNRTTINPDVKNEWYAADRSRTIWYGTKFVVTTRVNAGGQSQPQLHHVDLNGQLTGGQLLGDGLDYEGGPSVACAATGTCMATGFAAGNPFGGTGGIWARRFNASTLQPIGNVFYLDDHSSPVDVPWVVYASHIDKFQTAWYRRTGNRINFRVTSSNGTMGPLDINQQFGGGGGGEPQLVYNPQSQTSVLISKFGGNADLVAVEIGDNGYPLPQNPLLITNWDGQVLEYRPTLIASEREPRWIVTYVLAAGGRAALIEGTAEAVTGVSVAPSSLSFSVTKTGSNISGFSPQPVSVTFGSGPLAWTATTSAPWLQVTGGSGTGNGSFSVTVINPGNVIGSQTSLNGTVILTASGAPNSPVTVPVSATVSAPVTGGQITKPNTTNLLAAPRHDAAYDSVNDVYLLVHEGPPVRGQFLDRNGAPVGAMFNISLETPIGSQTPYTAWSNVAFGGTPQDPTFLVTYLAIEGSAVPKYGRLVRFRPGNTPLVSNRTTINPDVKNEWYAADRSRTIWYGTKFVVTTRVNAGGQSQPQLHHFDLNGQLTGGQLLGDGLDYEGGPSVACAPTGICVANGFAAGNPFGGTGGIWARRFNPTTLQPIGNVFYLDDHSSPVDVPWVVYASHINKFQTAWYRRTGNRINFRLTNTDGTMGPLDVNQQFGSGGGGEPQLVYNSKTKTSLLISKFGSNADLVAVQLGDNGYPLPHTPLLITPWDGQVLEYRPTLIASDLEPRWLVTYVLAAGGRAALIQGTSAANPDVTVAPTSLGFSVNKTGSAIGGFSPQNVAVTFEAGPLAWTASTSTPWLQVTGGSGNGDGSFSVTVINPENIIGSQTSLNGSVTLTAVGAPNSPVTVPVALTVISTTPTPGAPFGQVDTPAINATGVQGALAITGWALDDTLVSSVQIYRTCFAFEPQANCQSVVGAAMVWVAEAVFVTGARGDVEALFPQYPNANRAGWGVQILTNSLPHVPNSQVNGGQGLMSIYAVATDNLGNKRLLGRSYQDVTPAPTDVTLANDTIAKPFGTLDTPLQGQSVSGTIPIFGWALTPDADAIAGNGDTFIHHTGSTITMLIDGVPVAGTVAFGQCRGDVGNPVPAGVFCNDDIANIFGNATPQAPLTPRSSNPTRFRNLDMTRGAIGSKFLDTTLLTNGLHTISWSVVDSLGRTEGVGSRFFTVNNGGTSPLTFAPASSPRLAVEIQQKPLAAEGVWGRTGFNLSQGWLDLPLDENNERRVRLPEMGRLELWLGGPVDEAFLVANGTLQSLPGGSTLDGAYFAWAPGPGFVGHYDLVFVRGGERLEVQVTIVPPRGAREGESEIRMHLDAPATGWNNTRSVTLTGWALDTESPIGAGIEAVHVWGRRLNEPAAPAVFLGAATIDQLRPDVARQFDGQFGKAGFSLTATLPQGDVELTAYVWNRRTNRWEDARSVVVTVR